MLVITIKKSFLSLQALFRGLVLPLLGLFSGSNKLMKNLFPLLSAWRSARSSKSSKQSTE